MACGDRYKDLLVVPSGHTADSPWGDSWYSVPTFWDYDQWRNKATEVALMVNAHWRRLVAVEAERNTVEKQQLLIAEHDGLIERVQGLPGTISEMFSVGEVSWAAAIDRAVSAARDGTCVLEQIDDAIIGYGVSAPKIPGGNTPLGDRPGSGGGKGKLDGALLLAVGLGAVGVWLWAKKGANA